LQNEGSIYTKPTFLIALIVMIVFVIFGVAALEAFGVVAGNLFSYMITS